MFPILIRIPGFELTVFGHPITFGGYIATYGFLVAAAYFVGILWLKSQIRHMGLSENRFWALIYSIFAGAIIGGKLLYVALNWSRYASGELSIIGDFRYGFVFYGGFLGAILAGAVYISSTGLSFARLSDYFGVALPFGHTLGRLGCFAAGCCYGRETEVPWAVRFSDPDSLVPFNLRGRPLHPTQLYEALGDLIVAAILYELLKKVQSGRLRKGTVFLAYIVLYAGLRFLVEFYRGDDRGGFLLDFSPSQWAAMACFAVAGATLMARGIWAKKSS